MTQLVPVRRRLAGLLAASHPQPAALVTVLGGAMAAGAGAGPVRAALVTAAVGAGQLSVGWSNDWVDAARDRAVGRRDKPVVGGAVDVVDLRRAAAAAALACVVLSLATGLRPGLVHVAAVACAWAYNLVLKSTVASWVPYAVSFGLLPAFCVLAVPGSPHPARWVLVTGALLGAGAHLANVLPDLEDDAATGVRGLPHRLGRTRSAVLAPVLLLAAVLVATLGVPGPDGRPGALALAVATLAAVLAVAAGAVALTRTRSRAPFGLSMAVAALCVVVLVTAGSRLVAGGT